jgi:hypothetical protein
MPGDRLMGYKLRREVRDALPPGLLTSAERLLVLEIADQCRDTTRECFPGTEALIRLTDLSERSIQELLNRIAKKWIELRVPLGKGKQGQPYYSHAGRRITYRFPPLAISEATTDPGAYDATDPGASEEEGATDPSEGATDPSGRCDGSVSKVRQIRGPSPHSSSKNTSSLSSGDTPADDRPPAAAEPEPKNRERDRIDLPQEQETHPLAYPRQLIAEHFGITDPDEADELIGYVEAEHKVHSPGFWITTAKNGTAVGLITKALAQTLRKVNVADAEPCPLPDHRGPVNNCHRCWGDRKAGDDPYAGREHLRPDWWYDVYVLSGGRAGQRPGQPYRNQPEGAHAASWGAHRNKHQPFLNPEPEAYDQPL